MSKIKLDSRLSAVASLVRKGSVVADVGTDHAYIPAFLVQSGICPFAIAGDLRKMPLENANETIRECNLESKIKTVISNGLDEIKKGECDDVVIAGMGGLLIVEILERTSWIFDSSIRLVVQPMSHHEDVRQFFFEKGFEIDEEKCVFDSHRCYCVIAAHYSGTETDYSPSQIYTGTLFKNKDNASKEFLNKQYSRLKKRYDALKEAGGDSADIEKLFDILQDFESQRGKHND